MKYHQKILNGSKYFSQTCKVSPESKTQNSKLLNLAKDNRTSYHKKSEKDGIQSLRQQK